MTTLPKVDAPKIPWLLIGAMALVLAGGTSWYLWSQSQSESQQAILQAETAPVVQQDLTISISAAGVIKPITPVNISPKQSGRLVALYVDQGMRVKAGQLLARMDNSNLQGQLLQAKGSLEAAQANLQKLKAGNRPQEIMTAQRNLQQAQADLIATRSTYQSNSSLYTSGAVSKNVADISRSQYVSAQAKIASLQEVYNLAKVGSRQEDITTAHAQVVQAQGSLATIQAQVNDTEIRAPFDGTITQKYANPGAFVTPTTSASATSSATSSSVLAMAGVLEGLANVSESDIRNIHPGQSVDVKVDAYPGQVFRGKVRLVAPEAIVTQNVTSFEVRCTLSDLKHQLKSGMNMTASFLVGTHKNALLVPTTAIVSQAQGSGVYVQDQKKALFKPIKVGATIGVQSEVLSGLVKGERVYITFPDQRKPNSRPVSSKSSPLAGGTSAGGGRPPR